MGNRIKYLRNYKFHDYNTSVRDD